MNRFLGCVKLLSTMALLFMLATCLLSCTSLALELTCGGGSYPPPPFPTEELLLDESFFPEGWQAYERTFDPRKRLPAEQIRITLTVNGVPQSLIAIHEVYRFFDGPRCAALGYQKQVAIWFVSREGWGPWTVPAELAYQSAVADQFRFACRTEQANGRQICQAVGQYKQYMTRLHSFVNPDNMTFADLERILVAIDERMAFYLEEDTE